VKRGRARLRAATAALALAALALVAGAAGCEDLRQFTGGWHGRISPDPAHQTGFNGTATMHAEVAAATRYELDATITPPGHSSGLRFEPIRQVTRDVLADMHLPGDPLRCYLGFVRPPGEEPYLTVISLYAESRIEVRLIRGPDAAYGVFFLERAKVQNLNAP
jgi:hypothetical protein